MIKKFVLLCLFIAALQNNKLNAQIYFRLEADITVKEKLASGKESLLVGKVYFDRNLRKIAYHFQFPEKECVVINDTASLNVYKGTYRGHKLGANLIDFSVYSLILNGNLEYYGLEKTPYKLTNVEEDEGMVISTWELEKKYHVKNAGKIMLSHKEGTLVGIINLDENNNVISKQLFSDYIKAGKLLFPQRIIQITVSPDGRESKKITSYSNITLNNMNNESSYNPPFSAK